MKLDALFEKRRVDPPQNGPPADSSEMLGDGPLKANVASEGLRVRINYRDEKNEVSIRNLKVKSFTVKKGVSYIDGHCELRSAHRSFRIDRVIEAVDLRSGEVFSDPLVLFKPFVDLCEAETHEFKDRKEWITISAIIHMLGNELRILIAIAEADGKFGLKERKLLLKYASERSADLNLILGEVERSILNRWMQLQMPDETVVRDSIHRMAARRTISFEELWEVAELVAGIDGAVSGEERELLNRIMQSIQEVHATSLLT
jgi:tellurite resistance protein